MSFPVRCFTCGKVVGRFEEKYFSLIDSGSSPKEALDTIGMTRYCCRRMFLGHVNIIDKLLLVPKDIASPSGKKPENQGE
jgi:DNA-directed RNA polymerase subunit N (RpoN/RPB10)